MEAKKDCFAYTDVKKDGGCFALNVMDCNNCSFYKHSDNPKADQRAIMLDCKRYSDVAELAKAR